MSEVHDQISSDRLDQAAMRFRRQRDISNGTLDSLGDGVVTINSEGKIEFANRQAELLTGYTRDELAGQMIEVLVPDASKASHPGLRQGYQGNPTMRIMGQNREVGLRRKDGNVSPLIARLSSFPVEGEGIFHSIQFRVKETDNTLSLA